MTKDPTGELPQSDKPQNLPVTDRERKYREALALILPLAKGYAAAHPVGSNQAYVDEAEEALALPTEQDKGWLRTGNEARPVDRNSVLEEANAVVYRLYKNAVGAREAKALLDADRAITALKREGDAP